MLGLQSSKVSSETVGRNEVVSQSGLQTYKNPDKRKQFESFAEDGGHYVYIDAKHQGDNALCSCGWSGTPHWDGAHLAWVEWRTHVLKSKVIVQVEEPQNP